MIKPIVIEAAVVAMAALGYLTGHGHSAAAPQAVAATGSAEAVRLTMPEPQAAGAGGRGAWLVPATAVIHIRDTDYVLVKGTGGHHYRRLAVQGHPLASGQYAITGGLDQPAPVVNDGGQLIDQLAGQG